MALARELTIGKRTFRWGERTYVMGIINVTPDSFSGDGLGGNVEAAVAQGVRFAEEGADILDVGGESTRPAASARLETRLGAVPVGPVAGARPVSEEEELRRVVPVVEALAKVLGVPISVDTMKAGVAQRALGVGASMINDVSGFTADPAMASLAAERRVPSVLMHRQRSRRKPDLMEDVAADLLDSRDIARGAGLPDDLIILDPGIGFGKVGEENFVLLRRLRELRDLGYPLLVGTSRKSSIGMVLKTPASDRVEGTAATVAVSIVNGADIVRVHDVKQMVRVARVTDAIVRGWTGWRDA